MSENYQVAELAVYEPISSELSKREGPRIDVATLLLSQISSENTKRAYAKDLAQFFESLLYTNNPLFCHGMTGAEIGFNFVSQPRGEIAIQLSAYKALLQSRKGPTGKPLAEATINRYLAPILKLLSFANRAGVAECDGKNLIDGEKVTTYRDTRGISADQMSKLCKLPAKLYTGRENAERRARDSALLTLLCQNGLRCDSVIRSDLGDFEPETASLWIHVKRHGSQKKRITLTPGLVALLTTHLIFAPYDEKEAPLFRNLTTGHNRGERLTHGGLRAIIARYGSALGVPSLRPHKLRHSSITALLDATGGDVRAVQKFSGHAQISTLLLYDDNRADKQGEMSLLLAKLLK